MDYQKAASYWIKKDEKAVQMERELLFSQIERFLEEHNTCALATGYGDFIRCTPIEYSYRVGKLWMLSEGGLKFLGLMENKNVSIAIYSEYKGFNQLNSVQITGTAELVEPWTTEYLEHLEYKRLPAERLKKLPSPMHLIRIKPSRIDYLCSDFKKLGYDTRQHICLCGQDPEL